MTPLARLLGRWLPTRLATIALALIYVAMILAIANLGSAVGIGVVYLDIDARQ